MTKTKGFYRCNNSNKKITQSTIAINADERYQAEPWGSHEPRQTQQKSNLQRLQTMWLQPPSFSIVVRHLGHSCNVNERKKKWHYIIHTNYTYANSHRLLRWLQTRSN